jgi:hypothetical protein
MIDEVNNSDKKKDMIVCEEIIQVPSLIEERLVHQYKFPSQKAVGI